MHGTGDRVDGVTLFAGARDANRILDYPSPRLPSPAVAGLGYSLAQRRRSAVIGARCKTEIRSQLPSAGGGSGEHLASKDCRAGGTHSVQRDEQLSLLFDHRVLRVGRVVFLLNLPKLGRDQGEASVSAFECAT